MSPSISFGRYLNIHLIYLNIYLIYWWHKKYLQWSRWFCVCVCVKERDKKWRERQSYFWSMVYKCPVIFCYHSQAWIPLKKHDRLTKVSKQCLHSHSKLSELFTFDQKSFYCLLSWDIITFPKHGRIPKLQEIGFDFYWPRFFFSFADSIRSLPSLSGPGTGSVSKDRVEVKHCLMKQGSKLKLNAIVIP